MGKDHSETTQLQSIEFIKLLAHDLRWEIVRYLVDRDYRVQELVDYVDEPMNLVSYHLKKLRDADIVLARRSDADARDVYYTLNLEFVHALYSRMGISIHPSLSLHQPQSLRLREGLRVLVLCTHNSARSQMLEGLLKQMSGQQIEVYSAGRYPTEIHPDAIKTMQAMDIDISGQQVNHVDDYQNEFFDYVITVCDYMREGCLNFDGEVEQVHWGVSDPTRFSDPEERAAAFLQAAQFLKSRVMYFLPTLN